MNPALAEVTEFLINVGHHARHPVAIFCNGQLCLEKIVTTSEQSGMTMAACAVNGQIGVADWLAKGPYHEWKLQRYKCVMGKYTPKSEA